MPLIPCAHCYFFPCAHFYLFISCNIVHLFPCTHCYQRVLPERYFPECSSHIRMARLTTHKAEGSPDPVWIRQLKTTIKQKKIKVLPSLTNFFFYSLKKLLRLITHKKNSRSMSVCLNFCLNYTQDPRNKLYILIQSSHTLFKTILFLPLWTARYLYSYLYPLNEAIK